MNIFEIALFIFIWFVIGYIFKSGYNTIIQYASNEYVPNKIDKLIEWSIFFTGPICFILLTSYFCANIFFSNNIDDI